MDVLGKRWNGAIIHAVGRNELRFVDVRRLVPGISDALLTARLTELADCGIVDRREIPDTTRCRYALTEKGRDLVPALDALADWSRRWDVPVTHADDRMRSGDDSPPAERTSREQTAASVAGRTTI